MLVFEKTIKKMSIEDFIGETTETELPQKKAILEYMKKYPPNAFTSQPVYDRLSGEKVFDADNGHGDGKYEWYESDIYHFEKYNLKLNDDFVEYVLNRS